MIYTLTKYNLKGQIDSISDPYFSTGGALWNTYLYDYYGRKTNLNKSSGRNTTWQYINNSITETTNGNAKTTTYSSDGTISSSTDNGGTINYTYFPDKSVKTITAPGGITTSMQYDIAGNQTQLTDPSAGTITYIYDGFRQLTSQQNARSQTTQITYYSDGRINQKIQSVEGTTTYYYNLNSQLAYILNSTTNQKRQFVLDQFGRDSLRIDSIPGTSKFTSKYSYDGYGRLNTITHPSGIVETYNYNQRGYFSSISAGGTTRWRITGMNANQQITGGTFGSNLNTIIGYDNYGYITSQTTGTIQEYSYNFTPASGNLNWRQNNKYSNLKEDFTYDNLERLDKVKMGSTVILHIEYDGNKGAITTKTDVGTMQYATSGKPYAISTINPVTPLTPPNTQTITYTSFDKISTISENNFNATFTYGIDDELAKMVVQQGSNHLKTRWYPCATLMKDSVTGTVKTYTYIGGDAYTAPCVAIKQGINATRYYYLIRDHLGSITHISDSTNTKLFEYSYDAWGRMRDPSTWVNYAPGSEPALLTGRGYTGHEHLPWFNLINMNGRVYDALSGMFLSPDPYVQQPGNTQSFNRYTYCLNNPLIYTDPTGFSWIDVPEGHLLDIIKHRNLDCDGGGGFYNGDGGYGGGYGYSGYRSSGSYSYNREFGYYQNGKGEKVSFDEVEANFIAPNVDPTWSFEIFMLGEGNPFLIVSTKYNSANEWERFLINIQIIGKDFTTYN
jgi:RHS repeat-associated protein